MIDKPNPRRYEYDNLKCKACNHVEPGRPGDRCSRCKGLLKVQPVRFKKKNRNKGWK